MFGNSQGPIRHCKVKTLGLIQFIVNPRKLERGFRMIRARIPSSLPLGHEDNDAPTFCVLLSP